MARRAKNSSDKGRSGTAANLFLVRHGEAPVEITRDALAGIGRSDQNEVVLEEPRVSRRHAQVTWDSSENTYKLHDLNSSNGTFLNGTRLRPQEPVALRDGDKIRISSVLYTVRIGPDARSLENELEHMRQKSKLRATVVMRAVDFHSMETEPAMTGDLQHVCPLELFQILETGCKTGQLTVCTPGGSGLFVFDGGRVIAAEFGTATGETAVFSLLPCAEGTFAFTPCCVAGTRRDLDVPTGFLLMEGCRLMDEATMPQRTETKTD